MYAARWFPFHDYAADRATAEFTIIAPNGIEVAGTSDEPITRQTNGNLVRHRFVRRQPSLIGNFAAGRYVTRSLRIGNYDIEFFVTPGSEGRIEPYAEVIGRALAFYTQQYGPPAFGSRYVVAQIDDASLDAYAAPGMEFLSSRFFEPTRQTPLDERVQREVAFQWWGLTVGLALVRRCMALARVSRSGVRMRCAKHRSMVRRSKPRTATCLSVR